MTSVLDTIAKIEKSQRQTLEEVKALKKINQVNQEAAVAGTSKASIMATSRSDTDIGNVGGKSYAAMATKELANQATSIVKGNSKEIEKAIGKIAVTGAESIRLRREKDGVYKVTGNPTEVTKVTEKIKEAAKEVEVRDQTKISPWIEFFDDLPGRKFEEMWGEIRKNHPELPGVEEIDVVRSVAAGGGTKHVLRISSNCFTDLEVMEERGLKVRSGLWTHRWRLTLSRPQCQTCFHFGHGTQRHAVATGNAPYLCRVCGRARLAGHECDREWCVNCGGKGHFPSDRWCPAYQRALEAEIRKFDLDSCSKELTPRENNGERRSPRNPLGFLGTRGGVWRRQAPPPNSPRTAARFTGQPPGSPETSERRVASTPPGSPETSGRQIPSTPPSTPKQQKKTGTEKSVAESPKKQKQTVKPTKDIPATSKQQAGESDSDEEEDDNEEEAPRAKPKQKKQEPARQKPPVTRSGKGGSKSG